LWIWEYRSCEKFGPDDFFILKEGVAQVYDSLSLDEILAFIRLSCWDYKRFCEYLPALKKYLLAMTDQQKQRLHEAIVKVWECYLPIGEENDLAFELGTLLVEMEMYTEALEFLQCSVALNGSAPGTAHNIAVCYYSLGQAAQALEYVDRALELDPAFAEARALRSILDPALSNQIGYPAPRFSQQRPQMLACTHADLSCSIRRLREAAFRKPSHCLRNRCALLVAHCSWSSTVLFGAKRISNVGRSKPHLYRVPVVDQGRLRSEPRTSAVVETARDHAVVVVAAEVSETRGTIF